MPKKRKLKGNSRKKHDNKPFYKNLKFWIGLIGIILTFHQLAQPLFFSRIRTFEIIPLYIQSQINEGSESSLNYDYYRIFQIKYYVEPILWGKSTIDIKIPKGTELFGPITGFIEKNGYIEFYNYTEDSPGPSFFNSDDFSSMKFKINARGLYMKEIPLTLYFREKIELECSNPVFSYEKWWSEASSPNKIPKIYCYTKPIGYGQIKENKVVFSFDELTLTNRGDLEVKGFITSIPGDYYQIRACEDGKELNIMSRHSQEYVNSYISLDLKPGETRRIIILKYDTTFTGKDLSKIEFGKDTQKFFFENSGCLGDWNEFIK